MNTIIDNCKHCDKPIPTHRVQCNITECLLCARCEKCDYMICRSCDNKTSILKWVEVDGVDMYLCSTHSAEQSYKSSR